MQVLGLGGRAERRESAVKVGPQWQRARRKTGLNDGTTTAARCGDISTRARWWRWVARRTTGRAGTGRLRGDGGSLVCWFGYWVWVGLGYGGRI